MAYRVIMDFADALDKGHIYRAGDIYPRSGKPSELRVAELSGYGNKIGYPLIVEDAPEEKQQDAPTEDTPIEDAPEEKQQDAPTEDAPIEDAPKEKPKRGRPKKPQ